MTVGYVESGVEEGRNKAIGTYQRPKKVDIMKKIKGTETRQH